VDWISRSICTVEQLRWGCVHIPEVHGLVVTTNCVFLPVWAEEKIGVFYVDKHVTNTELRKLYSLDRIFFHICLSQPSDPLTDVTSMVLYQLSYESA
jgi:hypothetical protein